MYSMTSTRWTRRTVTSVLAAGCLFSGVVSCSSDDNKASETTSRPAATSPASSDGSAADTNSAPETSGENAGEDLGPSGVMGEGGASASSGEIPQGWPDDIPLPDGFHSTGGTNVGQGDQTLITLNGTTDQSADDVIAFYTDKLDGWEKVNESNPSSEQDFGGASFIKGERQFNVGFNKAADGTEVGLTYQVTPG